MRYVSLFSGVEAASVAWSRLGWEPLAFAEVDEFPSAVLACRFPGVPNLGDVCGIDWKEFHERHGAVDVLIGGSPCQSFSIAGNREGLEGESRLMYEYVRAVRDLVRASGGTSPRYIVWENVPGCLSSNKGRDFGCLLDELEECGYFVAWRTLDSQFARVLDRSSGRFAGPVPQRRRRVFLVGSLGGPSAADILFERQSLRGNHPKGREAREALAGDADEGAAGGYCSGFKWYQGSKANGIGYEEQSSPTISVSDGHVPAICLQTDHMGQNGKNHSVEICKTLDIASSVPVVCVQDGQARGTVCDDGTSTTLNASHEQPIVCAADDNGKTAIETDLCGSLKVGGEFAVNSSGEDVTGPLCARDFKGVGNEYVSEGKVICQKHTC